MMPTVTMGQFLTSPSCPAATGGRAKTAVRAVVEAAQCVLLLKNATVRAEVFGRYWHSAPSEEANDAIDRFFEALAIETPGPTTWVQYAIEPCGWLASYPRLTATPEITLRRDFAIRIDIVRGHGRYVAYELDEDMTRIVFAYQGLLKRCNRSARVAAKRLARAHARTDADDRIIDLCIGLEALLGSGFSETVHRLSMRASALLAQLWGQSSAELYRATRDLYAIRSKVVHGDHNPYNEPMLKLGGGQVHASRFATAALVSLLHLLIPDDKFDPAQVDQQFIFSAFDIAATHAQDQSKIPGDASTQNLCGESG
jgi:hypothetical protein